MKRLERQQKGQRKQSGRETEERGQTGATDTAKNISRRGGMGKKHYSGKELIMRRQIERQRQQGTQNRLKLKMQEINKVKQSVERTKKRKREEKGNDFNADTN